MSARLDISELEMPIQLNKDVPMQFEKEVPTRMVTRLEGSAPVKYHDIECCEWTRGIDRLMARYEQDRHEITSLVLDDPNTLIATIWKSEGPLAIDNECRCQMGRGENRSTFACAQCRTLRRLIDFRLGGVERGFQIECGDSAGTNLIVASSEVNSPFLAWDETAANRARFYVHQYHNLTICGTPDVSGLRCITGDAFTIRTIINWMIYRLFQEKNLPHCPLVHTAFVCRNIGYSLYTLPSIGSLADLHKIPSYHDINRQSFPSSSSPLSTDQTTIHPLKVAVARTMIMQLLVMLLELMQINFSHGTPSVHGLIFNKDPVSYLYDGVHIEGPLTVQIADLWNASATINQVHYFPKRFASSMYLEKGMFVPEIVTKKVAMAHCYDAGVVDNDDGSGCESLVKPIVCPANMATCPDETTYAACTAKTTALYTLTTSTLDIYSAMRHIGFPLYVGSFDFYCFMVSLMCDKSFYLAVKFDDRLYRLWSMMWLVDDLAAIEHKIEEAHQIVDETGPHPSQRGASNIAIDIIRGAWLRCDIVKFIWSLVKQGW